MNITLDDQFWNAALANAAGTLIAGIISSIVAYAIFYPIRRWFNQQHPKFGLIFQNILSFVSKPYLRLVYFIISGLLLYIQASYKEVWFALLLITFLSFFDEKKDIYKLSSSSGIFFDDFKNSNNRIDKSKWDIKTGQPSIYLEMGRPKLDMTMANPIEATNSFLLAKGIEMDRGIIECDAYLSPGSVLNIVLFCDAKNDNWYMARFDSRSTEISAFLIKDQGRGVNWRFDKRIGIRTTESQWHSIRVEFNSERIRMFQDGDFLGEITNPPAFGKRVGLFNECGEVLIGDFRISNFS